MATASFPTRRRGKSRAPSGPGTFIQRSRSESSEQKAIWNNDARHFFDISEDDKTACRDALAAGIAERLKMIGR